MSVKTAAAITHRPSLPPDVIEAILQAGMSAPSGDNLQPWRVAWHDNTLLVHHDPTRDTSLYNVRGRASFIALGAMIENFVIAASTFGYQTNIRFFPERDQADLIARICFDSGGASDPLGKAISQRCVNRKPYARHRFQPAVTKNLDHQTKRFPGVSVRWLEADHELKMLGGLLARADRLLFENQHLHKQLFSCLRWTKEEVEETRDGLPIETLELGTAGARAFRKLRSWRLLTVLNTLGFSRLAARHSADVVRKSSAIGLITTAQLSAESFLEVGRAFERLWLEATAQGFALQPITGFVLLQLRLRLQETEGLTLSQIEFLNSTRDDLAKLFHLGAEVPAIMFRIGLGDSPSARTIRRQVAEPICQAR